jgi:acetate---CoA ligase (ADP-forming)
LILDIADMADLAVPPLSDAARADIVGRIGPITGDGNPLDAWGSGAFAANLPQALSLFAASPDHDIVVFCRDNAEDMAFDTPDLVRSYLDMFTQAAAQSSKPHYLLHSRPGIMDRAVVAQLRAHGISVIGGLREGLTAIDRLARFASRANS